jgi:PiT family inorganic phosphate transporter
MLAFANGANDNFKGVATLLGSHTTNYRRALNWACSTTLAGSIAAVWIAQELLDTFSGRGLVPILLLLLQRFRPQSGWQRQSRFCSPPTWDFLFPRPMR